MTKQLIIAGIFLLGWTVSASAADCPGRRHEGVWAAGPVNTGPLPSFCSRVYSCGPRDTVMTDADCKMMSTPKETVRGACSAGRGPVDSCNECLTNPPSTPCEWWLVNK